jgi:hypothetical protein
MLPIIIETGKAAVLVMAATSAFAFSQGDLLRIQGVFTIFH